MAQSLPPEELIWSSDSGTVRSLEPLVWLSESLALAPALAVARNLLHFTGRLTCSRLRCSILLRIVVEKARIAFDYGTPDVKLTFQFSDESVDSWMLTLGIIRRWRSTRASKQSAGSFGHCPVVKIALVATKLIYTSGYGLFTKGWLFLPRTRRAPAGGLSFLLRGLACSTK